MYVTVVEQSSNYERFLLLRATEIVQKYLKWDLTLNILKSDYMKKVIPEDA